jgi:hypothetical protein
MKYVGPCLMMFGGACLYVVGVFGPTEYIINIFSGAALMLGGALSYIAIAVASSESK